MKVLLVAHQCSPYSDGDFAVGWGRLLQAARIAQVHLLTGNDSLAALQRARAASLIPPGVTLHAPPASLSSRAWQRFALLAARQLHRRHGFHLVHFATPTSLCQPPRDLQLGIPTLWGPLTGAETAPLRLLPALPPAAIVAELVHTARTLSALWLSRRTHRAATTADALFAATSTTRHRLRMAFGAEVGYLLETGLLPFEEPDRTRFHERLSRVSTTHPTRPLRLLWAGDLLPRNALPILLRALAVLGTRHAFELQVIGAGPMARRWLALARQLGLQVAAPGSPAEPPVAGRSSVHFLGPLPPQQLRAQFLAAELYCHTTLRQHTAQPLLDALSAGLPILSFDLHHARDLVTPACGTLIAATSPRSSILHWAQALRVCAGDPALLLSQSLQATLRARHYLWQRNGDRIHGTYARFAREDSPHLVPAAVSQR